VIRDNVKRAHLLKRGEEDLVYLSLEFNVLKNELTARRSRKIEEEYVTGEHRGLNAVP
jgi:hypothetical protein